MLQEERWPGSRQYATIRPLPTSAVVDVQRFTTTLTPAVRMEMVESIERSRTLPLLDEMVTQLERLPDLTKFYDLVLGGEHPLYRQRAEASGLALHFELENADGTCHTLWADCDNPESVVAVRAFHPAPSIVVRSGTLGRVHAYWPLVHPLPGDEARRLNWQLAAALAADPQPASETRYFASRPPGSTNYKSSTPAPVVCVRIRAERFAPDDVRHDLPSAPRPQTMRPDDDVHVFWERIRSEHPPLADHWESSGPYSGVLEAFDVPEWEPPTDPPSAAVRDYWNYDG